MKIEDNETLLYGRGVLETEMSVHGDRYFILHVSRSWQRILLGPVTRIRWTDRLACPRSSLQRSLFFLTLEEANGERTTLFPEEGSVRRHLSNMCQISNWLLSPSIMIPQVTGEWSLRRITKSWRWIVWGIILRLKLPSTLCFVYLVLI